MQMMLSLSQAFLTITSVQRGLEVEENAVGSAGDIFFRAEDADMPSTLS